MNNQAISLDLGFSRSLGMDFAADIGAGTVVFHPSSDAWDLAWTAEECRGFVHEGLDELVPAARERGRLPASRTSAMDTTTPPTSPNC